MRSILLLGAQHMLMGAQHMLLVAQHMLRVVQHMCDSVRLKLSQLPTKLKLKLSLAIMNDSWAHPEVTQTCKQEYASAGKILVENEAEAMGRHEGEAMGRQTDLVLDASLPKHKNT